jgi:hypothetical protein
MQGITKERLFFHSPFSPIHVQHEQSASLLLQFFLSALFSLEKQIDKKTFIPHSFFLCDRMKLGSSLDELMEHVHLFYHAFPSLQKETKEIENVLEALKKEKKEKGKNEKITRLFSSLIPFLELCKDNENLLFFLLKNHHKRKELHAFLTYVSLSGEAPLKKHLIERFKLRGFFSVLAELEELTKNV